MAKGVPFDPSSENLSAAITPEKWKEKTMATLLNEGEFLALKEREGLHVVGVTGFSGQWSEEKIAASAELAGDVKAAYGALGEKLDALKVQYGDKLVVSSGATNEGVPKIIYDLCSSKGIAAMGVTSAKAAEYQLGEMKYLIVMGNDWGEESPTFLNTSDEFLMLGGGGQAKREAIAAATLGKTVTIFQGFKGSSDAVTAADVSTGVFVARH